GGGGGVGGGGGGGGRGAPSGPRQGLPLLYGRLLRRRPPGRLHGRLPQAAAGAGARRLAGARLLAAAPLSGLRGSPGQAAEGGPLHLPDLGSGRQLGRGAGDPPPLHRRHQALKTGGERPQTPATMPFVGISDPRRDEFAARVSAALFW